MDNNSSSSDQNSNPNSNLGPDPNLNTNNDVFSPTSPTPPTSPTSPTSLDSPGPSTPPASEPNPFTETITYSNNDTNTTPPTSEPQLDSPEPQTTPYAEQTPVASQTPEVSQTSPATQIDDSTAAQFTSPYLSAPSVPQPEPTPVKKPHNKKIMIALAAIVAVLVVCAVIVIVMILNANSAKKNSQTQSQPSSTQTQYSDTYNLSELTADLEINKSGVYELYGKTNHSVIINSEGDVTLRLNGSTIAANKSAAIANISPNALLLEIADGTVNNLSDGGATDYDGCIYSDGPLTIYGDTGVLNVTGQQTDGEGITTKANDLTIDGGTINIKAVDDGLNAGGTGGIITINDGKIHINAGGDGIDSNKTAVFNGGEVYVTGSSTGGNAGIDTDDGYTINGGILIALGSDMLEAPSADSKQNSLALALDSNYASGANVVLAFAENSEEIINFAADENFRTLVISSLELKYGTYNLLINNEPVIQNLNVIDRVTTYGNLNQPGGEKPGQDPNAPQPDPNSQAPQTPQNSQQSPANQESSNNSSSDSTAETSSNDNGDTFSRIPLDQLSDDSTNS